MLSLVNNALSNLSSSGLRITEISTLVPFAMPLKSTRHLPALAALMFVASGATFPAAVRAADPYDKSLEARVEALEKELNLMEGDSRARTCRRTPPPCRRS